VRPWGKRKFEALKSLQNIRIQPIGGESEQDSEAGVVGQSCATYSEVIFAPTLRRSVAQILLGFRLAFDRYLAQVLEREVVPGHAICLVRFNSSGCNRSRARRSVSGPTMSPTRIGWGL
jgi:hypothetical protein